MRVDELVWQEHRLRSLSIWLVVRVEEDAFYSEAREGGECDRDFVRVHLAPCDLSSAGGAR